MMTREMSLAKQAGNVQAGNVRAGNVQGGLLALVLRLALVALLFCSAGLSMASAAPAAGKADPENTLYMDLTYGRVVIRMRPDLAPAHVARIKELTRQGFYDGLVFHRVIPGFMAQGGDPTGTGTGGSGKKLAAEFSRQPHVRGTVSMARANDPNSADSQFFICFDAAPSLDGQYSVWGEVVSGMEFVDQIKKGDARNGGRVPYPDHIVRMQVAADAGK